VIEWEPVERLETERMATPLELSVEEPRVVLPSRNLTVPVGAPDDEVTVAVNLTVWLCVEGFGDEVSEVDVAIKLLTVWVSAGDVLRA
jgi:hypothetical protein